MDTHSSVHKVQTVTHKFLCVCVLCLFSMPKLITLPNVQSVCRVKGTHLETLSHVLRISAQHCIQLPWHNNDITSYAGSCTGFTQLFTDSLKCSCISYESLIVLENVSGCWCSQAIFLNSLFLYFYFYLPIHLFSVITVGGKEFIVSFFIFEPTVLSVLVQSLCEDEKERERCERARSGA